MWLSERERQRCSLLLRRLLVASLSLSLSLLRGSRCLSCSHSLASWPPNLLHISFISLVHHFFVIEGGEERLIFGRWTIVFLIPMLESSSRSLSANPCPHWHSCVFEAWCSTIIEVSCSSLILSGVMYKYSHAMMARWCPSSARMATNQASSSTRMALRSITIMIASSSLITVIIEYTYGH